VAGSLRAGASLVPYLGALSARTGASLWENTAPEGPPGRAFDEIAVNGSRVVGVVSSSSFAVHAYDVATGMLEWQALDTGIISRSIGLNDDAVYIAGLVFNPAPGVLSELMVRAYAASTGELLWDDRSHPSTVSPFTPNFLLDLALDKSRLYVVGYTIDEDHSNPNAPSLAPSLQDFLIRAYDVRSDVSGP
jgi:outer membrane protein assembly factor BamB